MAFAAGTDRVTVLHPSLRSCCFLPFLISYTEHIKYPEPEHNAVNPNEKTTQLARKSESSVPSTQDQPQHPESSSSEAHGASRSAKW